MSVGYGYAETGEKYTKEVFLRLSRQEKVDAIVRWFFHNYEDPVHRSPYNGREGGYQYIYGGPYDANEEIQDNFSNLVDIEILEAAVEIVQEDGIFEWTATPSADDYDDFPDEANNGLQGVGDDTNSAEQNFQRLQDQLVNLETLIQPLIQHSGNMGHNNPPEPIDDLPITGDDWVDMQASIEAIREQTALDEPSVEEVEERRNWLSEAARKLSGWVSGKVDAGVGAFVKVVGAGLGAEVTVGIDEILGAINGVTQAVGNWINTLPIGY